MLFVLRGIKVRDSLARWGYIRNPLCAFCGSRETIDHCFFNCARVKCVWRHFSPLLSRVLGRQFTPTPPLVFFFSWPSISAKKSAIVHFVIKTIIYGVWYPMGPDYPPNGPSTRGLLFFQDGGLKRAKACGYTGEGILGLTGRLKPSFS